MEGYVEGGCFGEGKGDGGLYGKVLELWWNKWRWRRKKMMVGSCSCCCYYSCYEDEGGVGGFRVLMEE